jgi:hypothetical protein
MSRSFTLMVLGGAALVGGVVGVASIGTTAEGRAQLAETASTAAVSAGIARARAPQPGDDWSGCNAARAAGTAPIYRGEPGYRSDMDGDGDGIACEPVGGQGSAIGLHRAGRYARRASRSARR